MNRNPKLEDSSFDSDNPKPGKAFSLAKKKFTSKIEEEEETHIEELRVKLQEFDRE